MILDKNVHQKPKVPSHKAVRDEDELGKPSISSLVAALKESGARRDLKRGIEVHRQAVQSGLHSNMYVSNTLISMYSDCGCMQQARDVFDQNQEQRTTVSWNALLQGYVQNGESEVALELYDRVEPDGWSPNARTYLAALTACANLGGRKGAWSRKWLTKGKEIHSRALLDDCCNIFLESMLVSMYSRFGRMVSSRCVFDNMRRYNSVSWTALLQGYVENGESELALEVFEGMEEQQRTSSVYVFALAACGSLAARQLERQSAWLRTGLRIYSGAVDRGCCDDAVKSSLIEMYCKCGKMEEAQNVFNSTANKGYNFVFWNCLIQGYVRNGDSRRALRVLAEMDAAGIRPNCATFIAALAACGALLRVGVGRDLHEDIVRCGLEKDLATYLVVFYGQCHCIRSALEIFHYVASTDDDICAWNALMSVYSQHGNAFAVLELFQELTKRKVSPNSVTFTHVLAACSHAGLVDEGKKHFQAMQSEYEVEPDVIHHSCMVDLLARKNRLEEAVEIIRTMACEANAVTWTTVLCACRKWNNVDIARLAYDSLIKSGVKESAPYVLMANIIGKCKEN